MSKHDDAVFGMVGDPGHLVGREARVERVHHAAAAGDAEVQLEVAVAVPGQRGDAVAERQPRRSSACCDPARACRRLAVGGAVNVALDAARDDLGVVVVAGGELDQARDQQRLVLHQAEHRGLRMVWAASIVGRPGAVTAADSAHQSAACGRQRRQYGRRECARDLLSPRHRARPGARRRSCDAWGRPLARDRPPQPLAAAALGGAQRRRWRASWAWPHWLASDDALQTSVRQPGGLGHAAARHRSTRATSSASGPGSWAMAAR